MESNQIQPGGVTMRSLPAPTNLGGAPMPEGNSFASTFGRALQSIFGSASDGPSSSPEVAHKASGSTNEKSSSSSMPGTFLACLVTNPIPPAETTSLANDCAGSPNIQPVPDSTGFASSFARASDP